MSGAVAAHAAYNGSGTQGLAVTNKVSDDGDISSAFWNKNDTTRQLLYGSSIIEVPSSGASVLSYGGSRLFTVNNDVDCLGDLYIQVTASFPTYSFANNQFAGADITATPIDPLVVTDDINAAIVGAPFTMQSIINRVEIQVGTQIWQTLEHADLTVVNSTELSPDAFAEISRLTSTNTAITDQNSAWLVIPALSKTLGPRFGKFANQSEDGYLFAAAPYQDVKIKVYFREFSNSLTYDPLAFNVTAPPGGLATQTLYFKEDSTLRGEVTVGQNTATAVPTFEADASAGGTFATLTAPGQITACNLFAKQQVMCNEEREQIKTMPMGLPKRVKMTQNAIVSDIGNSTTKTIDLDHFSLFASHLIISGNAGPGVRIKTAELKLNSSSFSGQLPGILLDSCTSDSLGIFANKYIYGTDAFNVEEVGIGTYVFPLASTAYSGSSVPLNRFDSIRLVLTFTSAFQPGESTFINVTCVGETTALYKGGASSLAMY